MKTLYSILFSLVAFLGMTSEVMAHEGHDHSQTFTSPVCATVSEAIDRTIIRYNDHGLRQKTQFQELQSDLRDIKTYLQAEGADTTELEVMLPTLDTKIATFETNIALLLSKLQAAQQFPCTTAKGKFKTELQLARAQQEVVRQDLLQVREYYFKLIKPSLLKSYSQL